MGIKAFKIDCSKCRAPIYFVEKDAIDGHNSDGTHHLDCPHCTERNWFFLFHFIKSGKKKEISFEKFRQDVLG